jgi:DNA-binding CsgD family transcriptional regulator
MHRLRGEHDAAEAGYRDAHRFGREPQPGLALLRLAQGDVAAARASIRRVAAEAHLLGRWALLSAEVEVALATGDIDGARAAADRLAAGAADADVPLLAAAADHARGAVLLAAGDAEAALSPLREAAVTWQRLGAPYGVARSRALLATACHRLGDRDAAGFEADAARAGFESLGAGPDLAALAAPPARRARSLHPGGLTSREAEVLRRVAAGLSNREIAAELGVSDHTARRHLQNIFAKLGVSSRAAATAYAVRHGLA